MSRHGTTIRVLEDMYVSALRARWRHKVRGTRYRVLGEGHVNISTGLADRDEVVIYHDDETGALSVRKKTEFRDGRFEKENDA